VLPVILGIYTGRDPDGKPTFYIIDRRRRK
jgi:hypothetical protein